MLLLLHRLTLIIPPPPQKKENNKKLAKLLFCFIKNVHENSAKRIAFQLNLQEISAKWAFLPIIFWRNLSQIFQQNSCKISHFFCEFVSENPTKFDFFSVTYQRPCVMNSLCYKSSWSGRVVFFSPPPATFFPPQTSIYVQSWPIVFKKSEGLNYTVHYKHTRAHKMSGHLRIWPDKTYFWPDIVRWPAVNSSLARIIFCPIISISFPTQEFARRLWVCILSFWYICREYMHYIPYYLVRSSGLLGNILTTGLGGTCIHYF